MKKKKALNYKKDPCSGSENLKQESKSVALLNLSYEHVQCPQ